MTFKVLVRNENGSFQDKRYIEGSDMEKVYSILGELSATTRRGETIALIDNDGRQMVKLQCLSSTEGGIPNSQ